MVIKHETPSASFGLLANSSFSDCRLYCLVGVRGQILGKLTDKLLFEYFMKMLTQLAQRARIGNYQKPVDSACNCFSIQVIGGGSREIIFHETSRIWIRGTAAMTGTRPCVPYTKIRFR